MQSAHALANFAIENFSIFESWQKESNYLIQLSTDSLSSLQEFLVKLENNSIAHTAFYEPDLDNILTAICIEPTEQARKITGSFPLMLKEFNTISTVYSQETFQTLNA